MFFLHENVTNICQNLEKIGILKKKLKKRKIGIKSADLHDNKKIILQKFEKNWKKITSPWPILYLMCGTDLVI